MNSFLKKQGLTRLDLFYLAALTLIGLSIRVILRVVITDDWLMYWDPWISDIKEMGFSYLATDRYDYTPTFIYILWVISKLPINPMTAYKGLHCILDFVAAAILGKMIYKVTGSRRKGVLSYGLFLIVPTIWANSALWAQCDIIFMTFLLLCFYYLFADRPCRAMFFYGMAFVFKLQSLFIFPFLVILWVNKKVDLKHFLWIPALYFLSIVPAWIAGRPLMELINIYMAQGAQDVWSLSIKWPNIYQIIGNQFFLLEYASAGTWLILGILMVIMFAMAQKRYRITNEFIVQMALFFAILTPWFLPHMHERYGCVADILAIIYAMMNRKKFYFPLVQILVSFNSYMAYLSHLGADEPTIYYGVWAFVELGLLILVGLDIWHYMQNPENQLPMGNEAVKKKEAA
ncbi:Predicted integral membrane protein [uncultured Clostridium sp.]|nr:Predicted integral membrane protein [uncultured Clostridium sp.]